MLYTFKAPLNKLQQIFPVPNAVGAPCFVYCCSITDGVLRGSISGQQLNRAGLGATCSLDREILFLEVQCSSSLKYKLSIYIPNNDGLKCYYERRDTDFL